MEIFGYFLLTTLWWLSSLSIFLPFLMILHFSKSVRDKWYSFIYAKAIIPMWGFQPLRKRLFTVLEEHLPNRKKSVPLEILEIGIGPGSNFQFYPENSNLTALDMNPNFVKFFRANQQKFPQVNLKRVVLNVAEDMAEIEDNSFDVVISTHVLCSTYNTAIALKEVQRVLKPGGKYLFMEHVAFPKKEKGSYLIQQFAAPLWKTYFDGCYPNRNSADLIYKAGFRDVYLEHHYPSYALLFYRPQILGVATNGKKD